MHYILPGAAYVRIASLQVSSADDHETVEIAPPYPLKGTEGSVIAHEAVAYQSRARGGR